MQIAPMDVLNKLLFKKENLISLNVKKEKFNANYALKF
jgi:hypothetical protein